MGMRNTHERLRIAEFPCSERSVDTNTWRNLGNLIGRPFVAESGTTTLAAERASKPREAEPFHNRCTPFAGLPESATDRLSAR